MYKDRFALRAFGRLSASGGAILFAERRAPRIFLCGERVYVDVHFREILCKLKPECVALEVRRSPRAIVPHRWYGARYRSVLDKSHLAVGCPFLKKSLFAQKVLMFPKAEHLAHSPTLCLVTYCVHRRATWTPVESIVLGYNARKCVECCVISFNNRKRIEYRANCVVGDFVCFGRDEHFDVELV